MMKKQETVVNKNEKKELNMKLNKERGVKVGMGESNQKRGQAQKRTGKVSRDNTR